MDYEIGIDAGGTHCTAIAYTVSGKELVKKESGQGNIIVDYEGGIDNIAQAIAAIQKQVNGHCLKVLVGIAGLSIYGHEKEVAHDISKRVGNVPIRAITDSELAWLNGLEGKDGAIVIAGTGSVVNGYQKGKWFIVGGYGQILGDEGSAYAITVSAMKQALASWDKRQENRLIDLFTTYFNVTTMSQCNAPFYDLTRPQVAALAVNVAELADQGNLNARQVIQTQGHLLGEQVVTCLDRYQSPKPMSIALTGAVLTNNALLRNTLERVVKTRYPMAAFKMAPSANGRAVLFDHQPQYQK